VGARQLRAKALRRRAPRALLWKMTNIDRASYGSSQPFICHTCMNHMYVWMICDIHWQSHSKKPMWFPCGVRIYHSYMYIIHTCISFIHVRHMKAHSKKPMWYPCDIYLQSYMYEWYTYLNNIHVWMIYTSCAWISHVWMEVICISHYCYARHIYESDICTHVNDRCVIHV